MFPIAGHGHFKEMHAIRYYFDMYSQQEILRPKKLPFLNLCDPIWFTIEFRKLYQKANQVVAKAALPTQHVITLIVK